MIYCAGKDKQHANEVILTGILLKEVLKPKPMAIVVLEVIEVAVKAT